MTAPKWEVRQDPRDPNAWDVYAGPAKVAHLPWQRQADAEMIAAARNACVRVFPADPLAAAEAYPEIADVLSAIVKASGYGVGTLIRARVALARIGRGER